MTDGSKTSKSLVAVEVQSPNVIERRSNDSCKLCHVSISNNFFEKIIFYPKFEGF